MRPGRTTDTAARRRAPLAMAAIARACCAAIALAALPACGAASSFDGTTYRGPSFSFRVGAPPARWQRIDISQAALAFRDDAADATIAVNARCGVDGEDVPLASLTQHLFLAFTEREILAQEVVPFDGREAMHTLVLAKLDGVPKKFDVWILKKDGCVYDLYLIAQPSRYDRAAADFDRFVHGFATVSAHAE